MKFYYFWQISGEGVNSYKTVFADSFDLLLPDLLELVVTPGCCLVQCYGFHGAERFDPVAICSGRTVKFFNFSIPHLLV